MSVTNSVSLRRFLVFLSQCVCCALTVHLHKSSDPEVLHNTQPRTQIHTNTYITGRPLLPLVYVARYLFWFGSHQRETITADRLPKSCSITKTAIIINDIYKYDSLLYTYGKYGHTEIIFNSKLYFISHQIYLFHPKGFITSK